MQFALWRPSVYTYAKLTALSIFVVAILPARGFADQLAPGRDKAIHSPAYQARLINRTIYVEFGPNCDILGPGRIITLTGLGSAITISPADSPTGQAPTTMAIISSPVMQLPTAQVLAVRAVDWQVHWPDNTLGHYELSVALRSAAGPEQLAAEPWLLASKADAPTVELNQYFQWQLTLLVPSGQVAPLISSLELATMPAQPVRAKGTLSGVAGALMKVWILTLTVPLMVWLFNICIARFLAAGPYRRRRRNIAAPSN